MRLTRMERIALYLYCDDSLERTIKRLRMAAALSPRQGVKKLFCSLLKKLENVDDEGWQKSRIYECYVGEIIQSDC